MKNLLALALLALPLAAQQPMSWGYNYPTGSVICSTAVTTNCLDHFEVLTGATVTTVALGVASPSGLVSGYTASPVLSFGTYTISVIMVARAADGSRITSDPKKCTATVSVAPGAPINFVIPTQ